MTDTADQMPIEEKRKILFVQLLTSFQQAAWTGLGKIQGPDGKTAVDLDAASAYIDLLDMLRDLTKGNLDEELARLLDKMVGDLKLNFLEESDKASANPAAEEGGSTEADSDDSTEDEQQPGV